MPVLHSMTRIRVVLWGGRDFRLSDTPLFRKGHLLEPVSEGLPLTTRLPDESLYTEYGLLLRGIAMRRYRVPPDDAEALVHDVFVSYLERRPYIRDVKGWLAGAVGNASKNYLRKRRPEAELLPEHEEAIDTGAEQRLERWMYRSMVASVLARLGERCRETLRRYYLREETKERIAEHLDTSPGNVLQLLVTCRRRAQEILQHLSGKKP